MPKMTGGGNTPHEIALKQAKAETNVLYNQMNRMFDEIKTIESKPHQTRADKSRINQLNKQIDQKYSQIQGNSTLYP